MSVPPEFNDFVKACEDQGVNLDPRIIEAGRKGKSSITFSYEPTPMSAALVEAGVLTHTEKQKLSKKPVDLPPAWHGDIAAQTLANIVNSRFHGQSEPGRNFSFSFPLYNKDICADAEVYFLGTFQALAAGNFIQSGACEIIRHGKTPVMVRKDIGASTAVTLQPITSKRARIPAGSIVQVVLKGDTQVLRLHHTRPRVMDVRDVKEAAFLRLSAFAWQPKERREMERISGNADQRRILTRLTVSKLLAVAGAAAEQIPKLTDKDFEPQGTGYA